MRSYSLLGLALLAASASAVTITVSPDEDFEAKCLMEVQPGDTCYLEEGDHEHDGLTRVHGTEDARITITGDSGACIKGSNTQDRALQIAHNYYTIKNICFDGEHGSDHVATAIYILGADKKSDDNGVESSVTGTQLFDLEIKNFSGECVHFRYFVTYTEVSGCTIQHCGIDAFEDGGGGKVGEAIYVGTALDQVDDDKAPEPKLRSGSADNVSADVCKYNWIHHNTFRTYGNECVDIKEGSEYNLVEHNVCEQQKDANSGCFGARGSHNTFRYNEIAECEGAGIRMGGDKGYGEGTHIYGNNIQNCENGAFSVMSENQGTVCENNISGVDQISYGEYDDVQEQFTEAIATGECSSDDLPGDISGFDSAPAPEADVNADPLADTGGLEAGINYTEEAKDTEPEIETIETNESAGSGGLGQCGTVLKVSQVSVQHPEYADSSTDTDNLFDGDLDTYFSVHRESTYITFELEEEAEVEGMAIGFFMKDIDEERIQTFDVATLKAGDDDWKTVISRKESSGSMDIQTFPFSSRTALYVRLETHGNTYNNWSAFTEVEICGPASEESNALFGGMEAIDQELEVLADAEPLCTEPTKLAASVVSASGNNGNVRVVLDGNFETRWSTTNTQHESDINNDKITLTLLGDTRVSHIKISFYDGHLANQYFSIYTQAADDATWTNVIKNGMAEKSENLQTFDINMDVKTIYVVGNGNDVGFYSKFSEIELYGC